MIRLKKIFFVFLLFSFVQYSNSQSVGNIVSIQETSPVGLNVCFNQKTVSVSFQNPSPFVLKNVTIEITMPNGLNYVLGSINGATEQTITPQNTPVFSVDSIKADSTKIINFILIPTCNVIPFLDQGGVPRNNIKINYTANGYNFYDEKLSDPYIVDAPNVSIAQITNQTYTGNVGDSYQRCISIINGGTGALKNLKLNSFNGSGISVNNFSPGNWTTQGTNETIILNGSQFSSIGDGDSLFETGEIIVICEDITILNCFSTLTEYETSWGCEGDTCQTSFETANAFFPNTIPNITTSVNTSFKTCFNEANRQEILLTNNGVGDAENIKVDMFQNTSGLGYVSTIYTDVDINSVFYIDALGDTNYITVDSAYNKSTNPIYSCISNPKGGFVLTIPLIKSGETFSLQWDVYNCCKPNCGNKNYNDWRYIVSYNSACGGNYNTGNLPGREYGYTRVRAFDNGNTPSLFDGSSGNFSFYIDQFAVGRMSADTNGLYRIVIRKSPCMNFTGNLNFTDKNNSLTWQADSVYNSSDSIVGYFNGPVPFSVTKGVLEFDYTINCAGCTGGSGNVNLDIYYTPNTNCACELWLGCTSTVPVSISCPSACEGFIINKYSFERINFDNPDYDDDGLPDNNLTADKDSVEKQKIIYGDTVMSFVTGKVSSSSNWIYLYGKSELTNKNYLSLLSADLKIIDTAGNIYDYPNIPFTSNDLLPNKREMLFNFSIPTLSSSGSIPNTFQYKNGDSLVLVLKYFAENNVTATIQDISNNLRIYLSDTVNPTNEVNKFDCFIPLGNIANINYYTTISYNVAYQTNSCDQVLLRKYYYLSIGPCCASYTGGNLFRREYRHFSELKNIGLILPSGYNIINSKIREYRSKGSGVGLWSNWKYINPISTNNDSILYRVDTSLYSSFGGPAFPSDEGFYGMLEVLVEPSCKVIPDSIIKVPFWTVQNQFFNDTITTKYNANASTSIKYNSPNLNIQAVNPSIVAPNNTVTWTLIIDNLSNISDAPNFWLKKAGISGVNILSIYDLKNNVYLSKNTNDFFIGDTIYNQENRRFEITADYTYCFPDSLLLDIGWNCIGYPNTVSDILCDPITVKLEETPLIGAIETKLISQPDTISMCDTATYIFEAKSIQRGTVYKLQFFTILPPGVSIINSTSFLSLFDSTSFISISDPINVSGSRWRWDLHLNNQYLDSVGLKGILDTLTNRSYIKYSVTTDCNFSSGDILTGGFNGQSSCGQPTNISSIGTNPLHIKNATPRYDATIKINTTYLTPCLENTSVKITVINTGPNLTYLGDSITLQLPVNINFINGSFIGLYNPPNSLNSFYTNGSFNYIKWAINTPIALGDSSVFTFKINANPNQVNCDVFNIRSFVESYGSSFCSTSNSYCNTSIIVNDTSKNIFTYKAYLNLSNANGYSIPNPNTGDIGYVNFDIFNSGEKISDDKKTIVNYYFDSDNNNIFSIGDIWFNNDTITDSIPNLGVINFFDTINIPAGFACRVIAVVDTSDNPCTCVPSQIIIDLPYKTNLPDTVVCANDSFPIGLDPLTDYSYTWSPSTYLSDPNSSNPIFNYPFNTLNDTLVYVLEIDRINCLHYDTMKIIINGNPTSNAGPDQNLCTTYLTSLAGNQPLGTSFGLWSVLTGPNNPSFSDSSLYNTNISGLIEGSYQLVWTVSNGNCNPVKDTIIINVYDQPTSNAGPNQNLCNTYITNLAGNQPIGTAFGVWNVLTGPNTPLFSDSSAYNTNINGLIEGEYQLIWSVSNGNCLTIKDTVTLNIFDQPISNVGPNIDLCNQYNSILTGNQPVGRSSGLWSFINGPNTPNINNDTLFNSTINNLIEGTYTLTWTINNGICIPSIDTLQIIVSNIPLSNAGPNRILCNQFTIAMGANSPQGSSKGSWTLGYGPNSPSINDTTNPITNITGLVEGEYQFIWTVSNGVCTPAIDSVTITIYNQPISNAGPDLNLCNTYSTVLFGNTPSGTSTGIWTVDNSYNGSSSSPIIATPTNPLSGLTFFTEGSYRLVWTISNGNCSPDSDTILINVFDSPSSNAGQDQMICNNTSSTLNANNPVGNSSGIWSFISGPNTPVFTNANLYNTRVTNLIEGKYKIAWTVINGNCPTAIDTLTIDVFDPPISKTGADQELCNQYTAIISANQPAGTSKGIWSVIGSPNIPTIANNGQYITTVSGLIEGEYTFIWTVSNGNCPPAFDTIVVKINDQPISNAGPDQNLCSVQSSTLMANINIGSSLGEWKIINAPNIPLLVNNNDPNTAITNLIEGKYVLIWTVINGNCPPAIDTVVINNNSYPIALFNSNTLTSCKNGCISFINESTINLPDSIVEYSWNFSNNLTSIEKNPTICFDNIGMHNVSLKVTSSNGCSDSINKSNYINIMPKPTANFNYNPQFDIPVYDIILIEDGSVGASDYKYLFGNGKTSTEANPSIFYQDSGSYLITQIVENIYGCVDTFAREILIKEEIIVYVPNTFTPGTDGVNDIFIPSIRGAKEQSYRFMIFNRWGQLIFETSFQNVGWDGTHKNKLAKTDSYVWKIICETKHSGETKTFIGHVNLLK